MPSLQELYEHMEWADSLVWRAVLASDAGSSDPFLLDTLFHLHLTQHAFLQVWTGEEVVLRDRAEFESVPDIERWARGYHEVASRFVRSTSDSAGDGLIEIPWAGHFARVLGRPPAQVTLHETLYQVVSHSTHHRGQVTRRLRELGVEPPLVDYIAWLWRGRPEPEWPS